MSELDVVSAEQLQRVKGWVERFGRRSVPVLVGAAPNPDDVEEGEEPYDDREIEFTHDSPWLSGKDGETGRLAVIRLGSNWRIAHLDSLEVHPRHAEITNFRVPETVDLEFPPPMCPYCDVDLFHDGDGWQCEQCQSSWADSGYSGHRRVCVEDECDGAEAGAVGEDGQPRCLQCQFLVAIGELEPTGPYKCSVCKETVIGMPYDAKARRNGYKPVCGRHQHAEEGELRWKSYLAERAVTTGNVL